MKMVFRSALLGALIVSPTAALAQGMFVSPGEVVNQEPAVVGVPMVGPGGLTEQDAVAIAMSAGLVEVEDVDTRMWDGNFEVEGTDASGDDLEVTIDGETGAILEIDD